MATKKEIDSIMKSIHSKTKSWTEKVYDVKEEMTAEAKKLSGVISEMTLTDGDKDKLASLVSCLKGEVVKLEKDNDLEFSPLTAIVITKVSDKFKHTYETDKVVISLGDGTAIAHDGSVGSHIPPTRKILRPATKEEIDSISDEQIKGLCREVNIVFA